MHNDLESLGQALCSEEERYKLAEDLRSLQQSIVDLHAQVCVLILLKLSNAYFRTKVLMHVHTPKSLQLRVINAKSRKRVWKKKWRVGEVLALGIQLI